MVRMLTELASRLSPPIAGKAAASPAGKRVTGQETAERLREEAVTEVVERQEAEDATSAEKLAISPENAALVVAAAAAATATTPTAEAAAVAGATAALDPGLVQETGAGTAVPTRAPDRGRNPGRNRRGVAGITRAVAASAPAHLLTGAGALLRQKTKMEEPLQ